MDTAPSLQTMSDQQQDNLVSAAHDKIAIAYKAMMRARCKEIARTDDNAN